MPPFNLAGIDHIVFRVTDHERMIAFYRDVLGCTLERTQEEIGLYQLRAGRALIDLVTVDGKLGQAGGAAPGKEGRNVDHVCLGISPFDETALRAHLEAHGVTAGAAGLRYGSGGEGVSLYFEDPEGNTIELRAGDI